MKMEKKMIAFALSVCTLISGVQGYQIPDSIESKMEAVIDSFITTHPNLKTSISVSVKTNKDQWSYAKGIKNIDTPDDSVTTETPYMFFSIAKNIVAALTIDLVEEGYMSLDDKIGYYNDFETMNPNISNDITLHQLLCHRSGLGENEPFKASEPWTPYEICLHTPKPLAEPGALFSYSNINYIILGIIIEEVTGSQVNELLRERFFDMLDIDVALMPNDEVPENVAALHAPLSFMGSEYPTDLVNFNNYVSFEEYGKGIWTGGGMISSPADIAQWGFALFSGKNKRLRKIGKIMKNSVDSANVFLPFNWFGGYGTAIIGDLEEKAFGFNGYGWGTATSMYYTPASKSCITIFINQRDVNESTHQYYVHFPLTKALNKILMEYRESRKEQKKRYDLFDSYRPLVTKCN